MVIKTIKISDFLVLKLYAPEQVFNNIDNYFPNTFETIDACDYEIVYNEDTIPNIYKNIEGKVLTPFRNSKYILNLDNKTIVTYAKKQEFSDENVILRTGNLINVFCENDCKSKVLIRLIIELIIRKLLEKQYYPLHASCVVKENKANIYFGKKGSGKSTALLSSVLLTQSSPLANDITFVGKEDGIWKAFGTSYDLTFDESLFSQIYSNKTFVGEQNLIPQYHSNKVRYGASEFCDLFNTFWVWSAPIENINIVNLSPNIEFKKYSQIEYLKALDYLKNYGKDHNFTFDDLLMINGLYPNFNYEQLAQEIEFNEIEGNILEHHSKIKVRKRS